MRIHDRIRPMPSNLIHHRYDTSNCGRNHNSVKQSLYHHTGCLPEDIVDNSTKMRKEGLHSLRWTTATGIGQCCPAIGVSQVDVCFGAQKQACNCGVIEVFPTTEHPEWCYRWTFSRCVPYRPAGLELKHCRILDKRDLMGLKTWLELTNCRFGSIFPNLFQLGSSNRNWHMVFTWVTGYVSAWGKQRMEPVQPLDAASIKAVAPAQQYLRPFRKLKTNKFKKYKIINSWKEELVTYWGGMPLGSSDILEGKSEWNILNGLFFVLPNSISAIKPARSSTSKAVDIHGCLCQNFAKWSQILLKVHTCVLSLCLRRSKKCI